MGGLDDPSNLIELTVSEHAEAHRLLFEKYGRWEDELAWKGLIGLVPHAEAVRQSLKKAAMGNSWRKGKFHSENTKKKISKNSGQSKKIHTPFGTFDSKVIAAKHLGVSENTLRITFNKNLDKPIDSRGTHSLFGKENIGKTPRQLGYRYA